ncbi:hypothetical protein PSGE105469_29385 [Pseudomonas gessardii]
MIFGWNIVSICLVIGSLSRDMLKALHLLLKRAHVATWHLVCSVCIIDDKS